MVKMADPQAVKSPIIMKVDSPVEDRKEQEENESNSEVAGGQVCSPSRRSFIAASRFGVNPFALKPNNVSNSPASKMSKSVLRPSQLGQPKPFALNPSKLNAFAKPANNRGEEQQLQPDVDVAVTTTTTQEESNGDAPKFMPLIVSNNEKSSDGLTGGPPPTSSSSTPSSNSFVFGQNLQERVLSDGAGEEPRPSTSETAPTNGTSDMLFSSAVVKEGPTVSTPSSKTLSESAREYEEQRANKRKYEEVEVVTGEENETNILHLCCKLFAFDKAVGNWQERGRGTLRLNDQHIRDSDRSYTQSRVLFRTTGVLRLILNTKIWAEMTIEQASAKSIRFTAMDASGEIKVFLVMANPEEIKQLYRHLQERLSNEQKLQNLKRVNTTKVEDDRAAAAAAATEKQGGADDDAHSKVKEVRRRRSADE